MGVPAAPISCSQLRLLLASDTAADPDPSCSHSRAVVTSGATPAVFVERGVKVGSALVLTQ